MEGITFVLMSKKQWFILRVDHHLGPFSHEDLIDLYERAKLREVDQLWREGMGEWKRFNQLEEFAELWAPPELPPDLPEIEPELEAEPEPIPEEEFLPPPPFEFEEEDEGPPPLPPLPQEQELEPEPEPELEAEDEAHLDQLIEERPLETGPSKFKLGLAALVCLLFVITGLMVFSNQTPSEVNFFEARVEKAQELKSFLRENEGVFDKDNMPFALSLSRDSQTLILASPYSGTAKVFLSLESVENKGLFSSPIVITAQADMFNHKAVFENLTWEQGRSLVPGFYNYEISAIPTGVEAKIRGALQRAGLAEEAPKPFKGQGEVLLSRWGKKEYEEKFKEFREKELAQDIAPLEERLQRYQTLESLAAQILELYKEVLPVVRRPKDMRLFEQRYASEVAGLLQELIIEAHKKAASFQATDPEKAVGFELLRDFGKDVGGLVSDMVTTTQETSGLNDVKKNRLKKLFENRVQALTQEAKKRQQSIREQIEDLISVE